MRVSRELEMLCADGVDQETVSRVATVVGNRMCRSSVTLQLNVTSKPEVVLSSRTSHELERWFGTLVSVRGRYIGSQDPAVPSVQAMACTPVLAAFHVLRTILRKQLHASSVPSTRLILQVCELFQGMRHISQVSRGLVM